MPTTEPSVPFWAEQASETGETVARTTLLQPRRRRATRPPAAPEKWRREWDSNPRKVRPFAGFQDRCLKPLGHLSELSLHYHAACAAPPVLPRLRRGALRPA